MEKKGLGKGFGALISSGTFSSGVISSDSTKILEISLENISTNKQQPRKHFDQVKLSELSQSIKMKGVLQPILVTREKGENYKIIAGERRYRAAKEAGLKTIPAMVRFESEQDSLEMALIENIQRDDLAPMEEARAYEFLLNKYSYTQSELALRVGKSRPAIANMLRLLTLPTEIQTSVEKGDLSVGHARSLLPLENNRDKQDLQKRIINENLSVREAETLVKQQKSHENKGMKSTSRVTLYEDERVRQTKINETRLSDQFSTKVSIKSQEQQGKVEIHFYDDADFNRIFTLLMEKH